MTQFVHVQEKNNLKTVAFDTNRKGDLVEVKFAVAKCGRRDHFNRKLGREIAQGRLNCPERATYRGEPRTAPLHRKIVLNVRDISESDGFIKPSTIIRRVLEVI